MLRNRLSVTRPFVWLLVVALLVTTASTPQFSHAQTREEQHVTKEKQGRLTRTYVVPEHNSQATKANQPAAERQAEERPAWVTDALQQSLAELQRDPEYNSKLKIKSDLKLLAAQEDDLGLTHVRLSQTHQGVEVFGGQLITKMGRRAKAEVLGRAFVVRDTVTTPTMTMEQAIQVAKNTLGYNGDFAEEPTARLVILPQHIINSASEPGATLTWLVELRIEDGTAATANHRYFVDAINGNIVWHYDNLQHATGTGYSLYRGRVALSTTASGAGFTLVDGSRGNATTTDLLNDREESRAPGTIFFSANNVWGNGSLFNRQSAAVDAHYGAMVAWDYYLNVLGRRGIDGRGYQMISRVHAGRDLNNANWNGRVMTYGDGDGITFTPLVALDIVGHEITHGVTMYSVPPEGLIYAGEPGAANESFSDIFGTAIEFYAGGRANYLLGEDSCVTAGRAFRDMAEPTRYGDPDHYSQRQYPGACTPSGSNDACGIHHNSGIMNKAFYLLAEGGRHSFSGITVTGIGRRSAEQIFYRTLTTKLSPTANFAEIARGTLSAAADLFGANSNQYRATEQAWTAVGVLGSSNQAPCFNCEAYQGKLYGPGDADIQPNDTYYYSPFPGRQQGWLLGPEGTDFDLYLFRWNGWQWVKVASSEGEESVEEIVYNSSPGYYMWQISSFSGRGSYQFWLQRP